MIRYRPLSAAWLSALVCAAPVLAQSDTIPKRPLFTWRDVAIIEAFAIATVAVAPLDTRYAAKLQDSTVQANRVLRRAADFVETVTDPGAAIIGIGLYGYGRLAKKPRVADLGLHGLEALVLGAQMGNLFKGIVGRARPYVNVEQPHDYQLFRGFREGSDYRAFPSGHTISAFAAASAVTSEMKRWFPKSVWVVAPVLYAGATGVGLSRMYDNKHWASDVITGAAVGTFAGLKVVHWHHMHPGNPVDRIFLPRVSIAPDGSPVLGLVWRQ